MRLRGIVVNMIISHKHKFIYLKSTKTASTSVEIALAEYVGENDIVTPISDEGLEKGYIHPVRNNDGFSEHMLAQNIYAKLDKKIWESYTKIMCIRNPWDRVISQAYMKMDRLGKSTKLVKEVVDFISYDLIVPFPLYPWSSLGTNYDNCIDFIIKYENLEKDCEKLGKLLNLQLNLPFAKNHWRTNRIHYSKYFDDNLRLLVNFLYQRDIYTFGYTYYDIEKEANIPNSFQLPTGGTFDLRFFPRLNSDMIILKNFADFFGKIPNYSEQVFENALAGGFELKRKIEADRLHH